MLLETWEFKGYWWLPSSPDDTVFGTLVFSQRTVRLELQGAFAADPLIPPSTKRTGLRRLTDAALEVLGVRRKPAEVTVALDMTPRDQPRIHGITNDHRRVTLDGCWGRGRTISTSGFDVTTYGAAMVLDGRWYEPDEGIRFDELWVRLSDLDSWVDMSGLQYKLHFDQAGSEITGLDLSYRSPSSLDLDLGNGTTLKIETSWGWSGLQRPMTETSITQGTSFRVCFDQAAALDDALPYVPLLRNFLSLAVGRGVQVLKVTGIHNPPPAARPDPFTKATPRKEAVELLYRLVAIGEEAERELQPDEMLFNLRDAKPRLQDVFRKWFDCQHQLRPVFDRYFHHVYAPPGVRELEFENLVRVLEAHHRRTTPPAPPDAEFQGRLDRIYASVGSEDDRAWLRDELEYSHEPTLVKRLKDALARCPPVSMRVIGNSAARKSFVWKVVETRNYETHLDPSKEQTAARGAELTTLVYQVRALVEMTFLLELGFACDEIGKLFSRMNRRYSLIEHLRGQA